MKINHYDLPLKCLSVYPIHGCTNGLDTTFDGLRLRLFDSTCLAIVLGSNRCFTGLLGGAFFLGRPRLRFGAPDVSGLFVTSGLLTIVTSSSAPFRSYGMLASYSSFCRGNSGALHSIMKGRNYMT